MQGRKQRSSDGSSSRWFCSRPASKGPVRITYITLDLSKEDHHEYYNGFTNRVLWPILITASISLSSRAGI